MTRDRRWWLAATPLLVLGLVVAEFSLDRDDRVAFLFINLALVLGPGALIAGFGEAIGLNIAVPLERRLFRLALAALAIGGGAFLVVGDAFLPWWAAMLPATVCYWLYAWLKAGPDPTVDHIARVFD
jgi:hypothetical protein